MPEEIVTRILRLPGYGVYAWEADEATNTLTLAIRQTAPSRVRATARRAMPPATLVNMLGARGHLEFRDLLDS